ncbi:unnamed protein product [Acidithrix sp. C25]|nr:unnamed protein product [Acidithrix sp. C25]
MLGQSYRDALEVFAPCNLARRLFRRSILDTTIQQPNLA